MNINKLPLVITAILSCSTFANNTSLIEREKAIMESNPGYEFNIHLKQASPMIYEVVNDVERFNQLEEIKDLLNKIVDNQEKQLNMMK